LHGGPNSNPDLPPSDSHTTIGSPQPDMEFWFLPFSSVLPSLIVGFSSPFSFPSTRLTLFLKSLPYFVLISPIPRLAFVARLIGCHMPLNSKHYKKIGYFNWRHSAHPGVRCGMDQTLELGEWNSTSGSILACIQGLREFL